MPAFKHPVRRGDPWPFDRMKVGDFFDMNARLVGRLEISAAATSYAAPRRGMRFATELMDNEAGQEVVRCWRTAPGSKA